MTKDTMKDDEKSNEKEKKTDENDRNAVSDENDNGNKSKLYILVNEIINHDYDNEAECQKKLVSSVNLLKKKLDSLDEFSTTLCYKIVESCELASDFQKVLFLLLNAIFLVTKKSQTTDDSSDGTDSSLKTLCQCTCDLIVKALTMFHDDNRNSEENDNNDEDCHVELLKRSKVFWKKKLIQNDESSKTASTNTADSSTKVTESDKTKKMMVTLKTSFLEVAQTSHQTDDNSNNQSGYLSYAPALLMAQYLHHLDTTTVTSKEGNKKQGFHSSKDDDANEFRRQMVDTLGRRLFPLSLSSTTTHLPKGSQVQFVRPLLETLTLDELDTHISGRCKLSLTQHDDGSNNNTMKDSVLAAMEILADLTDLTNTILSKGDTDEIHTNSFWDSHLMNTKHSLLRLVITRGLIYDSSDTNDSLAKATTLVLLNWILTSSGSKINIILEALMQVFSEHQEQQHHDNRRYTSFSGLCWALDQISKYFLQQKHELEGMKMSFELVVKKTVLPPLRQLNQETSSNNNHEETHYLSSALTNWNSLINSNNVVTVASGSRVNNDSTLVASSRDIMKKQQNNVDSKELNSAIFDVIDEDGMNNLNEKGSSKVRSVPLATSPGAIRVQSNANADLKGGAESEHSHYNPFIDSTPPADKENGNSNGLGDDTQNLAIAVKVTDEEEQSNDDESIQSIVEAEKFDPSNTKASRYRKATRSRKFQAIFLLFIILIVTTVIVVVLFVVRKSNIEEKPIPYVTEAPTSAPVSDTYIKMRNKLEKITAQNFGINTTFDIPGTPHYSSLQWMVSDEISLDALNQEDTYEIPETILTERLALSTFYYSLSQQNNTWTNCSAYSEGMVIPEGENITHCNYCEGSKCMAESIAQISDPDTVFLVKEHNTRWLSNTDVCFWGGIMCAKRKDIFQESITYVAIIELFENNLNGTIPPDIQMFQKLKLLRLFLNNISGKIPVEIGKINGLVSLDVSGNKLEGKIPSELYDLKLFDLNLGDNQLTGEISTNIGQVTSLKGLWLHNLDLTGNIPSEIGNLLNLIYISIEDNSNLNGTLPTEFGNLERLQQLRLSGNGLKGTLPSELGKLDFLKYIYLDSNDLSQTIPDTIYNLKTIERIYLRHNNLNGTLSTDIGNLKTLKKLVLNNNLFSGTIPTEIGILSNLVTAHFQFNQFNGTMPTKICEYGFFGLSSLAADCEPPGENKTAPISCACCNYCCYVNTETEPASQTCLSTGLRMLELDDWEK